MYLFPVTRSEKHSNLIFPPFFAFITFLITDLQNNYLESYISQHSFLRPGQHLLQVRSLEPLKHSKLWAQKQIGGFYENLWEVLFFDMFYMQPWLSSAADLCFWGHLLLPRRRLVVRFRNEVMRISAVCLWFGLFVPRWLLRPPPPPTKIRTNKNEESKQPCLSSDQ